MSDAVAKSLLSTCKNILKTLSEALTTLDSIGALTRLREDGEAMQALKVVSAFTQSLVPSAGLTTSGRLLSGSRTSTVEERNRLIRILGGHSSTIQDAETHVLEDPRMQDGRDEAIIETQAVTDPTLDYSDLHSPTSALPNHPMQRIYSLLVYFPAFFLSRERVTVKEKQTLLDIIHSGSGGQISNPVRQLTTTSYPRIRLIPSDAKANYSASPSAALITDDDAERLRRIQKELHAVQYQRWSNLDENCMRRDLFFVRTWKENPVVLIFKVKIWDELVKTPSLQAQRSMIAVLLLQVYPILAHYQRDTSSSGPRIALGKAASYRGCLYTPYTNVASRTTTQSTCFLVPVFNVDPCYPDAARQFAQDFAVEHSGGDDGVDDPEGTFQIYVDEMRDPLHWSAPGGAAWAAADSG